MIAAHDDSLDIQRLPSLAGKTAVDTGGFRGIAARELRHGT